MTKLKDSAKQYSYALDHSLQAGIARLTHGISPAALLLAFTDWYLHLLIQPAKQFELIDLYKKTFLSIYNQIFSYCHGDTNGEYCIIPNNKDKRFIDYSWQEFPYTFIYESFLSIQNWWEQAATNVHGMNKHHEQVVRFTIRQILDVYSPSNFPFLNPEIIKASIEQKGENYIRGMNNLLDDYKRLIENTPPAGSENYIIGKDVAATPGKVVYRNKLIELIQYSPQTETVYKEPLLITPAWIMKYYILDLKPDDSLVRYLIDKGHTVYMISWKNPNESYRNTTMYDYLNLGIMSALERIRTDMPKRKIHLVGYCLGGTLAAIAAATLARDEKDILKSLTLFAAQTDFTEPGELGLFIDESQIAFLENMMSVKGYLDTHQMAGAFQLLRSNDLIWSRMIHDYLLGQRLPLSDLMAWNADATRLPYKMHSEYLRKLFLNNELAEGKYIVGSAPIALADINVPIFIVATERDHVSPWKSVFKINLLTDTDVTFTLTSGGHNVGIVSKPENQSKQHYRSATLMGSDRYIDPDRWYERTKPANGSWWPTWEKWLKHYSEDKTKPPQIKNSIDDAPGKYVLEK